jgi:hypothetical protein
VEDEGIQHDVCVGNRELAVGDGKDLVIVGDVESWWGSAVGVSGIFREYVCVG